MSKLLLFDDGFNLSQIPGLQLLALPNRDLATGWTSDIKVVQDYSQGGAQYSQELSEYVQNTSGVSYATSTGAYGTWEFDVYKNALANIYNVSFINNTLEGYFSSNGNKYTIYSSPNNIQFIKKSGASAVTLFNTVPSYIANNTWYRIKVTRSGAGVFTVYIKGGSFGDTYTLVDVTGGSGSNPVTDNTYTTSNYFVTDLDAEDRIRNIVTPSGNLDLRNLTESTGSFYIDWKYNGNHGIYKNSMELNQVAGRTFYRFDATDDNISHGNPASLQVTNNFTIGVILKTSSGAASNPVISKYEVGTDNRSWMIQMASGDMKFYESSDGTSANTRVSGLNGTTNYDDAVARMFTFTKESNNVRGYVNATPGTVARESGALTVNSCYNSSANLAAGTRFENTVATGFFSGDIGLYFICNKVLTAGQISQIYNSAEVQRILRGMA